MNTAMRKCAESDLPALWQIGIETFKAAFAPMNTIETMERYLEEAFNETKLLGELRNADSSFYFLYIDETLAGYLKLNENGAQTEIRDPKALEIERIYVKATYQGKGLGQQLMDFALARGKTRRKEYLWLGVWEKNEKALRFYKRNGFEEHGKHFFRMGEEMQTDYILKKDL